MEIDLFLKINEYRISFIGFLILMTLTVVTGISVYIVMQRQTESILAKSLEAALRSSVVLVDSQIAQGMAGTQMLATRPFIIDNLTQINATPGNLKGSINLQRTAESFISNSFSGVAFYDARGTEVARSGRFLQQTAMNVFLNVQHSAYLLWDRQFILHANTDILDQQGRRIGSVMTEASLKLPYAFTDAASIGQTGEFALCAPLEEDPKSMGCFLSRVSGKEFKRLQRVVDKNALPMNYALDGKSGLIFAKDYRREKVVAAYSSVGKFSLGMVLKIDQSELYSPVTGQLKYIAALLLALIVLGGMLLYSMVTPLVRQLLASKQALQTENEKHLAVLHNASDGIHILDAQGNVIEVSDSFCAMLGYRREEMTGMNVSQWDVKFTAAELSQIIGQQIVQRTRAEFQTLHRRKDGCIFSVEISVSSFELDGKPALSYSSRDITERKKIEKEMLIAATAFESKEGMFVTDANRVILRVNHAFTNITGYPAEEVIGKNPRILSSGRQDANFYAAMWESINNTGAWEGEIWNRRKNGEVYPEQLTITAVKDKNGTVTNYVATLNDITMSNEAADKINNLAFYDPLTHLPNRRLLLDRLKQALASSARSGREGALLFIDLDNVKSLNDTLGHDIGDLLLQQAAQRLESCLREVDTVARLGGDEFVVVLEGLSEHALEAATQTKTVGEKILAMLNQPYQLDTHEYHSTASIGATIFSDHGQSEEELLKQADIAMYQAKKAGRNTLRFFDPQMQVSITGRFSLEGELRKALGNQEFQLYYQIQVDSSHRPLGAEALIRWLHPERGLMSPAQFIPLAEETGLILPIGQWVLETACAQLKAWEQDALTRDLVLAVNVSAKQFHQADFVAQVQAAMQHHAINPMLLKLELTEGMLLENIEDTIATMNALKEIGVQFSMDDFGTGYSSLQYLKRLPLNQIKIDQSFVRNLATDSGDKAVVRAIIAMAQSLNLDVIAEGVETEEQRQLLLGKGCTHYQGYLISKPVPIEQFEALLKQG